MFQRGGSGSLQMVSEPDTGLCANEEVVPKGGGFGGGLTSIGERNKCRRERCVPKGMDCDVSKDTGPHKRVDLVAVSHR